MFVPYPYPQGNLAGTGFMTSALALIDVADSVAGLIAFVLGDGQTHIERQPACGCGGVYIFLCALPFNMVLVE